MKKSKEKYTVFVQKQIKMETKYTETQDSAKVVLREFMFINFYLQKKKYLK